MSGNQAPEHHTGWVQVGVRQTMAMTHGKRYRESIAVIFLSFSLGLVWESFTGSRSDPTPIAEFEDQLALGTILASQVPIQVDPPAIDSCGFSNYLRPWPFLGPHTVRQPGP